MITHPEGQTDKGLPAGENRARPVFLATLLGITTIGLVLIACAKPTEPEEYVPVMGPAVPTTPVPSVELPVQAFVDRRSNMESSGYTEAELDAIASCPLAIFNLRVILTDNGAATIRELRRRNPDIIVVGILQVLAVAEHWNHPNQRERFPLTAALYDLLVGHQARTTAGETPMAWDQMPMVNPWAPGGLNQDLLNTMMDIIATHANRHPGAIDGVFHDFFSPYPWPYPDPDFYAGEVDLDGDGKGSKSDPDDLYAWTEWQRRLALEYQDRFGPGLVQLGNGPGPHRDPVLAQSMAGVIYEQFPGMRWGQSLQEGLDIALAHAEPGYLTPRRGRTWSLLWDHDGLGPAEIFRISSMLTGQFYAWTERFGFPQVDSLSVAAGAPLGPTVRTQNPDGSVTYRRAFENGQAVIETDPTGNEKSVEWVSP